MYIFFIIKQNLNITIKYKSTL